jgi:hypothetical protein
LRDEIGSLGGGIGSDIGIVILAVQSDPGAKAGAIGSPF